MKKIFYTAFSVLLAAIMMLSLCSCGTKTLHCDNCGKEIQVNKSSNMEEDWAIYCEDCQKELGLDDIVTTASDAK